MLILFDWLLFKNFSNVELEIKVLLFILKWCDLLLEICLFWLICWLFCEFRKGVMGVENLYVLFVWCCFFCLIFGKILMFCIIFDLLKVGIIVVLIFVENFMLYLDLFMRLWDRFVNKWDNFIWFWFFDLWRIVLCVGLFLFICLIILN